MTAQTPDRSTVKLREALLGLPTYKPGRKPADIPGVKPYKMSSNENPYAPLPSVVDVISQAAGLANRYPDMLSTELSEAIASRLGVGADEIVVGTGSSGVLSGLINATSEAGDEVVYAWRSFEAYPIMVGAAGARSVQVPVTEDGRHDLDAMADAITPNTTTVMLCTPNNPTGPSIEADELEAFLARVPDSVMVILDEAYLEFDRGANKIDSLAVYRAHSNVVLMRTFSKAYGLAGLRVGYAVARPELAARIRSVVIPFAVTEIASRAAIASLEAQDELDERIDYIVRERDRVRQGLLDLGYEVPESEANFVWLPIATEVEEFAEAAEAVGLSVRPFAGEGVRVSVEAEEANSRFLEMAAKFRGKEA